MADEDWFASQNIRFQAQAQTHVAQNVDPVVEQMATPAPASWGSLESQFQDSQNASYEIAGLEQPTFGGKVRIGMILIMVTLSFQLLMLVVSTVPMDNQSVEEALAYAKTYATIMLWGGSFALVLQIFALKLIYDDFQILSLQLEHDPKNQG